MPVRAIDLTIPEARKETALADTASLEQGKKLLERVQQAVGGADKLAAVRDAVETADFEVESGAMKVLQTNRWVAPEHFRQEMVLPTGQIVAYTDGKSG